MSLANQYEAIFQAIFDGGALASYVTDPLSFARSQGLTEPEAATLSRGTLDRIGMESLVCKAHHLARFFDSFPKTMYLLTSATRSIEALSAFFASEEFHSGFEGDSEFVEGFSVFLSRQVEAHATIMPCIADIYSFEDTLRQLRNRPQASDGLQTTAIEPDRPLRLSPNVRLRQFAYPVTEIIEYLNHYFKSGLYRLSALWALSGEEVPALNIPHESLEEPIAILFVIRGEEPSLLTIKISEHRLLSACGEGKSWRELVAGLSATDRSRADQWLDYCWRNGIINYA